MSHPERAAEPAYRSEVRPPRRGIPLLNAALLGATLITTAAAGAVWDNADIQSHPGTIVRGLPFGLTLLAILLVHEAGHYLMCVRHGVNASLPYFVPAPPLFPLVGTFGAFIRIRSRFPNRKALFDIGAAGPWAGFVVALAAVIIGLGRSTIRTAPLDSAVELGDSLLLKLITWLMLDVDPMYVELHPIALAGWFGLFVTSLNLIPVGQLDGGHVLYAAFGRTRFLPSLLVAFLLWLGLTGWPGWVMWALILTALTMLGHPTTNDDPRPLDAPRFVGALATLAMFVLTFVAEPLRFIGDLH
jgi:membrane-associated protease RseP (regulator of RpoE activity)